MPKRKSERKIVKGIIRVIAKPMGFVEVDGGGEDQEDIVVFEENLNCALNKDVVGVEIVGKDSPHKSTGAARFKGKVTKILERNKSQFVGTLEKSPFGFNFLADDFKFYRKIEIALPVGGFPQEAKEGLKALVELERWDNPSLNPKGKILQIIGKKGEHETEIQSILLDKGIVYDFPKEVEGEAMKVAENFKEANYSNRRDFRNVTTFTIDPVDAKDFDDALSYEELSPKTVRVGVHIADVSHFVLPGTALDREAKERAFSVYLVDRTIPMLPEVLSNGLCSLMPNVDRFAFAAVFDIDRVTGDVVNRWFGKTIINSNKRFSYEEAQEVLDQGGEFKKELTELNRLANIYREQNKRNGAIEFETDEVKFELDREGKPIRVYKKARVATMKMIEEWMLLANREVAGYISEITKKRGGAGIFRVHNMPDKDRIENLSIFVRALGHELFIGKTGITGKDINALLTQIEGHDSESLIKTAAIRSMAKAIYSAKNIGHFGLGFQYYTHFTSPIRRYPDLLVHRILQNIIEGGNIRKDEFGYFEKIARDSSEKEVVVQEAERDSIKYKQVEYMQGKIGEEFECTISGVTEWGMYVEEPNTKAEGLVRIRDIEGDIYSLDEKNYCLVGQNTKKKFSLGDKVKVKLAGADLDRKTLDFKLI